MSWIFEKVFEALPGTMPREVIQEGRFLWVTGEKKVYVYEFCGESSGHEPTFAQLDMLNYNHYNGKLKLMNEIDVPEGSAWIAQGTQYVYVANAYQFNKITRIHKVTKQVTSVIECPVTMNSNLILDNGRLWMVSKAPESQDTEHDTQRLYILNATTFTFASVEIPTRKTLARTYITPGWNGHIYVTNFNNVSLSKFSNVTGAYVGEIRTNAFPQVTTVTPERDIFVTSYAGMLTRINGLTDEVFNAYSTVNTAMSLAHQSTDYIWYCDSNQIVGRVNRNDNSLVFTKKSEQSENADRSAEALEAAKGIVSSAEGDNAAGALSAISSAYQVGKAEDATPTDESLKDWHIDVDSMTDTTFNRILVTTPFQYKQFDGAQWNTIDVKPYLIILGTSKVMAIRLDHPIWRENYTQISGQAMISTGSEDYMGEIG